MKKLILSCGLVALAALTSAGCGVSTYPAYSYGPRAYYRNAYYPAGGYYAPAVVAPVGGVVVAPAPVVVAPRGFYGGWGGAWRGGWGGAWHGGGGWGRRR